MSTFINFGPTVSKKPFEPGPVVLPSKGDTITTYALGEEGGDPPTVTTKAIGEEGGDATTLAVGEEGGGTTYAAPGENGTGIPDVTTKAIGEEGGGVSQKYLEGGGDATTLAVGEEGGGTTYAAPGENGSGIPDITTYAIGEEGGEPDITTLAVGEEGGGTTYAAPGENGSGIPDITTYAIGEEGGDGATTLRTDEEGGEPDITTLAAGEEGGGGWIDLPGSRRTEDYIAFLREADNRGNGNERLTRQEATTHLKGLQNQLSQIEQFSMIAFFINPILGFFLNQYKDQLADKVATGKRLTENFSIFLPSGRTPNFSNTIGESNINNVARLDGDQSTLSDEDFKRKSRIDSVS